MKAASCWVVGVVLGALAAGCGESVLCRQPGCDWAVTATFAEALVDGESYRLVVAAGDAEETCFVDVRAAGGAGGAGGESGAPAVSCSGTFEEIDDFAAGFDEDGRFRSSSVRDIPSSTSLPPRSESSSSEEASPSSNERSSPTTRQFLSATRVAASVAPRT